MSGFSMRVRPHEDVVRHALRASESAAGCRCARRSPGYNRRRRGARRCAAACAAVQPLPDQRFTARHIYVWLYPPSTHDVPAASLHLRLDLRQHGRIASSPPTRRTATSWSSSSVRDPLSCGRARSGTCCAPRRSPPTAATARAHRYARCRSCAGEGLRRPAPKAASAAAGALLRKAARSATSRRLRRTRRLQTEPRAGSMPCTAVVIAILPLAGVDREQAVGLRYCRDWYRFHAMAREL